MLALVSLLVIVTDATIGGCSASTESTGSTVEGGFVGIKAGASLKDESEQNPLSQRIRTA